MGLPFSHKLKGFCRKETEKAISLLSGGFKFQVQQMNHDRIEERLPEASFSSDILFWVFSGMPKSVQLKILSVSVTVLEQSPY